LPLANITWQCLKVGRSQHDHPCGACRDCPAIPATGNAGRVLQLANLQQQTVQSATGQQGIRRLLARVRHHSPRQGHHPGRVQRLRRAHRTTRDEMSRPFGFAVRMDQGIKYSHDNIAASGSSMSAVRTERSAHRGSVGHVSAGQRLTTRMPGRSATSPTTSSARQPRSSGPSAPCRHGLTRATRAAPASASSLAATPSASPTRSTSELGDSRNHDFPADTKPQLKAHMSST
jgi:hypothetical protein